MIITSRTEKFYKVEMTAEQAYDLFTYLDHLQVRHIEEICSLAKLNNQERDKVIDVLNSLASLLKNRDGN